MKNDANMVLLGVILIAIISGCITTQSQTKNAIAGDKPIKIYEGKKVLYIDSYHAGYEWSDGVTRGIENIFNNTGIELKILRMDTKRNDTEQFGKQAGLMARSVIEEFRPDVVIISDDPAFKYLLMPYYRDAALPFVFCGINWDASIYGAPYNNTAGMIEVSLTPKLITFLKEYSRGERLGFIAGNTSTDKKNAHYYNKLYNITFTKKYHVNTFEEWKKSFRSLQEEVDILILENNAGIINWNDREAEAFVLENTKIPAGAIQVWLSNDSLISMTKIPEEQGEWSASTALIILNGTSPPDIPITANKKGKLFVNLKIADKLRVIIRPELLKNAEIIR
ncbi:MAG TPA: ABC transporter substrate binding protein [Candidatus Methylomirabilis sp.]|nr:ABC transporter substrate binding protein [Candidatus Methylomirabilis sp.]